MKSTSLFLIFTLALCSGLMQSFALFRDYFDGARAYQHQVEGLKNEIGKLDLQLALKGNELSDFKQEVARVLPSVSPQSSEAANQVRFVASVAAVPSKSLEFDWSKAAFEEGKALFREKKYEKAALSLKKSINLNPSAKHLTECYFLQAESYFLAGRSSDFLEVVDQMVVQFPDHELTGFILLRMGQIFSKQNRPDEAREVYETVIRSFHAPELKTQASTLKSKLGG
ncbi:MAG: tol-pal system YbgF family protein [Pseudobdellovibrionaceae bacterium]